MRDYEQIAPQRGRPVRPGTARDAVPADHDRHSSEPAVTPALDAASVMHLQRTAGNQGVVQLLAGEDDEASPVHDVVGKGGGAPLDDATRASMESAFGASFEHVRVHTDGQASRSAESVGANAYTVGSDVVFRAGQYDPASASGQRTIAHELAHVVQQSAGPVDGTPAAGGIKVSDPSDRFERAAEHTADQVMAAVQTSPAPAGPVAAALQRQEMPEEEEELQTSLQRQEMPEEEELPM
jgi:hypothetical protein